MNPGLLRAERKQRGWSQADVAEALGTATKTVTRWELGHAVPVRYHREKLSALFGKTVEELGLLCDTDEDEAINEVEQEPSFVAQLKSEVAVPARPLADPAIPQTLDRHKLPLMLLRDIFVMLEMKQVRILVIDDQSVRQFEIQATLFARESTKL